MVAKRKKRIQLAISGGVDRKVKLSEAGGKVEGGRSDENCFLRAI
jgi:hypothetical protein